MAETINRDEYAKICDARNTLCAFCENDMCEKCIVTQLTDDAYNACPEIHDDINDDED